MKRFYREQIKTAGKFSFQVQIEESDLFIVCDRDLQALAFDALKEARRQIEEYITQDPVFRETLKAHMVPADSPEIIRWMASAAELYQVGPMAAVAGAVARFTGEKLDPHCQYLMIENGGDIYLKSNQPVTFHVWAGEDSPFRDRLRYRVNPEGKSLGICTSSGTIGHSLSFGKADAVVTMAEDPALADAAATAIANKITGTGKIQGEIEKEKDRGLLKGLIIVIEDKLGMWGEMEIV